MGHMAAFEYDHEGIRQSRTINGDLTRFLTDPNRPFAQVLEELDAAGLPRSFYTHGLDLISQDRPGPASPTSYYHADPLGSTRALTDSLGTATDQYAYEAFGTLDTQSGTTPNPYLFTGEQLDPALNHYYLRARYYSTAQARFTSQDPFQGLITAPTSLHRYLYANADPANAIDPSGHLTLIDVQFANMLQNQLAGIQLDILNTGLPTIFDPDSADFQFGVTVGTTATTALFGFAANTGKIARVVEVVRDFVEFLSNLLKDRLRRAFRLGRNARAVIGFASGKGISALTPNRLQHGTRHLTGAGLLPPWRGSSSPQIIRDTLAPILENPINTFSHNLRGTAARGFVGEIDGRRVVILVFSEGPFQGQLATAFVPTTNQLAQWGLLP
ncbi:MAG TPA: RHS repeat-associated core domain-containing protein [Acidobacteriota bacterium]|nr:RHS repeat-associated core domain-containing protein [Acidobacteriota bacterium]